MGKHFIDPKSSELCPFFKFFLVRRKLPFFWPKLLPALGFKIESATSGYVDQNFYLFISAYYLVFLDFMLDRGVHDSP
jgi:hypothetical protein